MEEQLYNHILAAVRMLMSRGWTTYRTCETQLREAFPGVPEHTLGSIYSLEYQRRMKRNHPRQVRLADDLYRRYQDGVRHSVQPGVLLCLSDEVDLSPALLARIILEKHYERQDDEGDAITSRSTITRMMNNTALIKDMKLAYEVFLCILCDDQYGPVSNTMKHSIGQQYEIQLQRRIRELHLPFSDEEQLRKHGYDKTPDVKLEVPIAVDGFIVNWIESKALFGDEEGHRAYLREQYLSYWNRFGPGLVIYWFGFVETLERLSDQRIIIIRDNFPANITFMDPTCIKPTLIVT